MPYFVKYKNFFKEKKYLKIVFFYFLVLIFIMIISSFLIYNNYKNLKKTELKANYISNLSALAENIDNSFNELQYTSFLLSSDSNLYDIFYSESKLDSSDSFKIKAMIDTLVKFKATKNLIDSVYVLHKASNEIIDVYGTSDAESFFSRSAIYEKYNRDFWMNLKVNTPFYQLLDPSPLERISYGDVKLKRNVIPFVTSNIESFNSKNILVINISELELASLLNKYKLLLSSKLFIINKQGVVFASTGKNSENTIFGDRDFLAKISSKSNFFDYDINGFKTLAVTYTSSSAKFNDFIYVALIPYYDFNQKLSNIKGITYSIIIFSVMLSTILAYMMSRKIYSPIKNLVSILNNGQSDNCQSEIGEIDYLNNQVQRILSSNETLKALASLSPLGSDKLKLYTETTNNSRYHYSINDENKLYNYLVGYHKEEAVAFMKLLIQKLYQGNPSEAATKKFYFNIYSTILRIIEEKNFDLPNLMGQDYIDIASNIEILSITDFNTYIFTLVDKLLSVSNNSIKIDILQITEYIKEHYHEDIYLEKVASTFNTSDTYLSRLFKESLGVGFHEYLTSLRVAKAKTLLVESDIRVTKVGEMVGFNTHSTFFRIFKKFEGVNPTQYRVNQKK